MFDESLKSSLHVALFMQVFSALRCIYKKLCWLVNQCKLIKTLRNGKNVYVKCMYKCGNSVEQLLFGLLNWK